MVQWMKRRGWLPILLAIGVTLLVTGTVRAAEFESGEIYRLPAGTVVNDDLYVAASEIYIDGTVQGDLFAAGRYVEINGAVTGDAVLAGAGVVVNGNIEDDVRAAGAGVEIAGTVGDDLIAAGGGGGPASMMGADQRVPQGVLLQASSQIGGDAILAGGEGTIAGTIAGNLRSGMNSMTLAARVGGDADLSGTTLQVRDNTEVAGLLRYRSDEEITIPAGTASRVEYIEQQEEPRPGPGAVFLSWLWHTVLLLLGFALLGWLLLRFAPRVLTQPASALAASPGRAGLYGFLTALGFIFLPIISALLVFLMVLFWGWFPGITLGLFLFGALAMIWLLSPLITGLWLGRFMSTTAGREANNLPMLLVGILLLVLLTRIPFLGWFIALLSFIFALGGLILVRRSKPQEIAPVATV